MLGMKNVRRVLSTYSADLFGINSALYELGGLIVMHDASGCNSTYNTHDEPRWYDIKSMIYISALTEKDVILGNENKLISDIISCVNELPIEGKPKFIVISQSILPHFINTDMDYIASMVEKNLGIRTFAFSTNGIDSYVLGANSAFDMLAHNFVSSRNEVRASSSEGKIKLNLLGLTPLDFSTVGNVESLKEIFSRGELSINSSIAMGNSLDDIRRAGNSHVNLVLSSTGIDAALTLNKKFGTPFIIGLPTCKENYELIIRMLKESVIDKKSRMLLDDGPKIIDPESFSPDNKVENILTNGGVMIVGEPVFASSLRFNLKSLGYEDVKILCPTEYDCGLLKPSDLKISDEKKFEDVLNAADVIIADPIYKRVLTKDNNAKIPFVNFPHEAFSGRMYRSYIPVFCRDDDGLNKLIEDQITSPLEIVYNDMMINPF